MKFIVNNIVQTKNTNGIEINNSEENELRATRESGAKVAMRTISEAKENTTPKIKFTTNTAIPPKRFSFFNPFAQKTCPPHNFVVQYNCNSVMVHSQSYIICEWFPCKPYISSNSAYCMTINLTMNNFFKSKKHSVPYLLFLCPLSHAHIFQA